MCTVYYRYQEFSKFNVCTEDIVYFLTEVNRWRASVHRCFALTGTAAHSPTSSDRTLNLNYLTKIFRLNHVTHIFHLMMICLFLVVLCKSFGQRRAEPVFDGMIWRCGNCFELTFWLIRWVSRLTLEFLRLSSWYSRLPAGTPLHTLTCTSR